MSDQALAGVLAGCTEEVLEQMFFVRPFDDDPNSSDSPSCPHLMAEVDFTGEPSGHLMLSLSSRAARSIAADFLAEDERVLSEQQIGEVVCELANIICGSVLTRVESRTLFRLASPKLVSVGLQPLSHSAAVQSLNLWNGNLTVAISTESPICPAATKSAF
ncbi:MAG: chemotaxis protein CheX [Acidobacteriia bacterium]|nr:chemotaxis protein CheX [Terriglobia bacterium]MBV8904250.1 chemotaxis protein CheX [Terriglobia bacterium]MBV9746887.1 chemotaxis protein CheX [Terriglobia bacterium]